MRFRLITGAAAALAVVAGPVAPAMAKATKTKAPSAHYYLALGDSLSVGYQPGANGGGGETDAGYTNDLFAYEAKKVKHLTLVELGCPGDTTTSMLTGQGNTANAKQFHCDRKGGSQLKAAELFLKAHHNKGEVPLITIDIGANDVDGCATVPASELGACVTNGESSINKNLPKILAGIKAAAPAGAKLSGMNLYDPFLEYELSSNSSQQEIGQASVGLAKSLNGDLASDDAKAGFLTADVADAFETYDTDDTVSYNGGDIPVDVARILDLTWMGAPSPVGPNIHCNIDGYSVIAGAFEAALK